MKSIYHFFYIMAAVLLFSANAISSQDETIKKGLAVAQLDKSKQLATPVQKVDSPNAMNIDKSAAMSQMKSPFKIEYRTSSVGGYFGRNSQDRLNIGGWIKCYVNNTSKTTPGDVRIIVYAADALGNTKVLRDSGIKRVRANSFYYLEYSISDGDRPSEKSAAHEYWVSISVSSEQMLPRVKSIKQMPRTSNEQQIGLLRTIADYLPGDFFKSMPIRRGTLKVK